MDHWIHEGAAFSVISRIEVLGFAQPESDAEKAQSFLALFTEVPLHDFIVQETIALRRKHNISVPDAVIAATALDLDQILITRNINDFDDIDGLDLINPFEVS